MHDGFYVDGTWRAPADRPLLDVISPATGELLRRIPLASEGDIADAVAAARRAFDSGPWPQTTRAERAALLRRLADAILDRSDSFMTVQALDSGIPVSGNANVSRAVGRLSYYADLIEATPEEELRHGVTRDVIVRSEPVGVVAAILPWNAPLGIGFMKLAPAIAAGCTMVVKTAPEAPLIWCLFSEVLDEVGFPPGVINVLCADRAESESLVRDPRIDKVSFTGSTAVGRRVGSICGADLKRCSLELGGKSAAVILDDVDLDAALPLLVRAATSNNGQACVLQSRVLVPRARAAEITDALVDRFAHLRVGDPLDAETNVGPLISRAHRERVEGFIASGKAGGATLLVGGERPADVEGGWYLEPTLFADVRSDMRIAREEIFGPVVAVMPYDTEDEAIAIANATEYGLSGTVWTSDPERALHVARSVRSGNFGVNVFGMDVVAPFGGMKASGIGREMGPEGLTEYLEAKSMHLPDGWVYEASGGAR
jgi:betaine-aldehyde dehydrogenase